MDNYIVTKNWSDPIFVEDCDKPKKCKEVKPCKPKKKCKDYKVAGFVDDLYHYKHEWREHKGHCKDHGHHCGGKGGHCGHHQKKHHKVKAPCLPRSKVFINSSDCASNGGPSGVPFRFRLPLPLAEYCGEQDGYDFDGFIKTYINFRAQVTESDYIAGLPAGTVAWLIVDVFDDTRCGRNKLMERVAVEAPLPEFVDGVWTPAAPFDFTLESLKKCVDFRDHILFRSYFVLTDGLQPDLRSNLDPVPITAEFVDVVDPTFEITAFPCYPGRSGHHHGHGGGHGGCFKGVKGCHRGNKCYDRRCN